MKYVGCWFRYFDISGRAHLIDELANTCDFEIAIDLAAFCRGGNGHFMAGGSSALQ